MKEANGDVQFDMTEEKTAEQRRIKDVHVKIGGRNIRLKYDMRVQMAVEDEMGIDFYELQDRLNKGKRVTKDVIRAIRIMGNEGLRLDGKEPDLTDEWLADHMEPAQTINYKVGALGAMVAGWFMETEDSEEEQDEVLNEIRKKNGNTD